MKTAVLLKRTPTLIVIAFLAYACYSIHASLPDSSAARSNIANGPDMTVKGAVRASATEAQSRAGATLRDPFRVSAKTADAAKSHAAESADDADAESLARIVGGLALDATFLQGKTRIAIIDGHMYHQGERLINRGETGKTHSPLIIQSVTAHLVTLSAHGKTFDLGYPDQLHNHAQSGKAAGPVPPAPGKPGKSRASNKVLGTLANQAGTGSKSGRSRRPQRKAPG